VVRRHTEEITALLTVRPPTHESMRKWCSLSVAERTFGFRHVTYDVRGFHRTENPLVRELCSGTSVLETGQLWKTEHDDDNNADVRSRGIVGALA